MEGSTITLRGKTRKGQNRINQFGSEWSILQVKDKVKFDSGPGPWLLLLSVNSDKGSPEGQATKAANSTRWIHQNSDPDFEIVKE